MSLQQAMQARSSANGFGRRKVEKDSSRTDSKMQHGKSNSSRVISAGIISGSKGGVSESPSRDRLVYLTTCLIGHHVEVQVKGGSVYSGIFHATNADRDFGIILKMACLTKDVSLRGQKGGSDLASKALSKTLIIPAHELVQVVAKDVPVTRDGLSNEISGESQHELMLDSYISQSRHVEAGRQLERWVPDEDLPQCPELENIFDSPWTGRSWDQFKVNETLFGVKSTFNEELYTTKLERGPQTRGLEEEALRIAREIEGEETRDLHLAEERGAYHANFDIDEETKYSSVCRGFDDSGCADENVMLNSHDLETFGDPVGPAFTRSFADVASGKSGKGFEGGRMSSGSLSKDEIESAPSSASQELFRSGYHASGHSTNVYGFEGDSRAQQNHIDEQGDNPLIEESVRTKKSSEEVHTQKPDGLQSLVDAKREGLDKGTVSSVTVISSSVSTKVEDKTSSCNLSEDKPGKLHVTEPANPRARPDSSASSTSDGGIATSASTAPGLSPSSSVGSLSSEKSTLNPNAKEFKLNPNAKSFTPTQTPLRPVSPVNDSSFYFPTSMPAVPHMHGMPVGIGVGPSFPGPQHVLFNPQAAAMQSPQAYFPANTPQYGQQMILGHPRQVMYMPGYPAEMAYKGREY